MQYDLVPLTPDELPSWDARIAPYESTQLFHRQPWLNHLAESRGIDIRQWAIYEGSSTIGYFCAGMLSKGPFRILGSPLKGWASNFMGPVVNHDFDQDAFLLAIDDLAEREQVATIEIENPLLDDTAMRSRGYDHVAQPTYVIKLTPYDTAPVWRAVNLKARQKVRKAQHAGCTVVEGTDPAVADELFTEFVEVLARKGLYPPYGREVPRSLFRCLQPHGLLLVLQVRDPKGDVIATSFCPHDEKSIYFWCGGSHISGWEYSPNDLIQWATMEWAIQHGLTSYNMCGYGQFKSKFGGPLEEPRRYQKYYSMAARWGRAAYAGYQHARIRARGSWERLTHPVRKLTPAA